MDIVTLHINSHSYRLPTDIDAQALEEELLSAVHTGGALVGIGLETDSRVSVLVTAQSQIVLEHVTVPDTSPDRDDPFPAWAEDLADFPDFLEP